MKKYFVTFSIIILILTSCTSPAKMQDVYNEIYIETPKNVLVLPPINKSNNVEAKELFYNTLTVPFANAGYYVIPSYLATDFLMKDSLLNSENLLHTPLNRLKDEFNADVVLFTIIHNWTKNFSVVNIEVEYILKSTKSNKILYSRRGQFFHNTSVSTEGGLLLNLALTAYNTSSVNSLDLASSTNFYTFNNFPSGFYSPNFKLDGTKPAGDKIFTVTLNENSIRHKKGSN